MDLNLWDNSQGNIGIIVNLGIIRKIEDLRMFLKVRDLMIPLPHKKKPPWKNEVMFT